MNIHRRWALLFVVIGVLLFTACQGEGGGDTVVIEIEPTPEPLVLTPLAETPEPAPAEAENGAAGEDAELTGGEVICPDSNLSQEKLISTGETVYANNCASCHQPAGEGIEGTFPALSGNEFVLAEDPGPVVETVVQGRGGMPAFGGILSAEEIAAVTTFIRSDFGNEASAVCPEQVEAADSGF